MASGVIFVACALYSPMAMQDTEGQHCPSSKSSMAYLISSRESLIAATHLYSKKATQGGEVGMSC